MSHRATKRSVGYTPKCNPPTESCVTCVHKTTVAAKDGSDKPFCGLHNMRVSDTASCGSQALKPQEAPSEAQQAPAAAPALPVEQPAAEPAAEPTATPA